MAVLVLWLALLSPGHAQSLAVSAAAVPGRPGLERLEVRFFRQVPLYAEVCRPRGAGPFKAVLLVHGGYTGPNDDLRGVCLDLAGRGYLAALPHLRGQGMSGGRITVCEEEGPDVRHLADLLPMLGGTRARAYVGVSMGGCVALSAARRDPEARGVAFLIGPTDFEGLVLHLRTVGRPDAAWRWEGFIGAPASECPDCYLRRSPVYWAAGVAAPLLTLAAGNDPIVPVSQLCRLAGAREAGGRTVGRAVLNRLNRPWLEPLVGQRTCVGAATGLGPFTQDQFVLYPDLGHQTVPAHWELVRGALEAWLR